MSFATPDADPELPDIDDRLVAPGTRYEMLDGKLVYFPPAEEPQARRYAQLATLLAVHIGDEFTSGLFALIRTSRIDDFCCHLSVWPIAKDPRTGGRQLPQLAFDVVTPASLACSGRKAVKLAARGVRRVFAIDVERSCALEWSSERGSWRELAPGGQLEDPALAVPLPIEAMTHAGRADDAVLRALIAKGNPVLDAYLARRRAEAEAKAFAEAFAKAKAFAKANSKAKAVLAFLTAREIPVGDAERDRILGERDSAQLDRWIAATATCAEVAELFAPRSRP